jgi:hypothetical protein
LGSGGGGDNEGNEGNEVFPKIHLSLERGGLDFGLGAIGFDKFGKEALP